ncbi:MAG: M23 family metallopeptidase [Xanthomonadales bacterium]|nr:M23 family metallopeptidase [Xanthomonadales bacterium]
MRITSCLVASVAALAAPLALGPSTAAAADIVTVPQGGVGRWTGIAAKECGIYGKRYAAVDAACYFPVDIRTPAGAHEIAAWDQDGKRHVGTLVVQEATFAKVEMDLPESLGRYLDPSAEEIARAGKERTEVLAILGGSGGEPRFSLPLAKPTANLPKSEDDFGSERTFNGKRKSLHSGRDYPVGAGNSVMAVADGKVVLAADHFYTGNAVYIDHGDGLVSMNFHLQSIAVEVGDEVKRGEKIGTIGGTGRATGPHLHLGLRWLGKRIDPALLLATPDALPAVSDSRAEAQHKIDRAERKEPDETDDLTD